MLLETLLVDNARGAGDSFATTPPHHPKCQKGYHKLFLLPHHRRTRDQGCSGAMLANLRGLSACVARRARASAVVGVCEACQNVGLSSPATSRSRIPLPYCMRCIGDNSPIARAKAGNVNRCAKLPLGNADQCGLACPQSSFRIRRRVLDAREQRERNVRERFHQRRERN